MLVALHLLEERDDVVDGSGDFVDHGGGPCRIDANV